MVDMDPGPMVSARLGEGAACSISSVETSSGGESIAFRDVLSRGIYKILRR